jgi:RNA polymerase sigma-70 factor, ECF subfamily
MKSDEELMQSYVAGDGAAFSELFKRYGPMLARMMRRQIRHEDDALELVQQTFLQLHRARLDFEAGRRLRPWLMTIAFNLKREYFRRRRRRPEAPLEHEPPASSARGDPVVRAAEAERLRRALDTLPDGQKEVITLHWFEELSFPEVAEILGLTVSAVKVRAHRGYQALRRVLEQEAGEISSPGQKKDKKKAGT